MHDAGHQWDIRSDTIYLNHGSFGPAPRPVRRYRDELTAAMDEQPMDFFVRRFESAWFAARESLAKLVGAPAEDLALLENATLAMNVVANSFPLAAGDEVVLTDHEYGAVVQTWQRACREKGARCREAAIAWPFHDPDEVVSAVMSATTSNTRLIVVSHITSPTALVLPVEQIVAAAKDRGIAVCVDGPHAIAQLPLNLQQLECDFYTASCHKWLSAPLGSGFLYVAPQWQATIRPLMTSWGRLPPAEPRQWWEHFVWRGTRNTTAMLAIPAAIDFLAHQVGWEEFRQYTHELARYARQQLLEHVGTTPWTEDSPLWYGSMASVPLPMGDAASLQRRLWENHGIEVPIVMFRGERSIRVSCHLYNSRDHIDQLCGALREELDREPPANWEPRRM